MSRLSSSILSQLLETKKESTINTFKRQLKCLGLNVIDENTLKGNIKTTIDEFMKKGYSTPKVYINALLNVYKVSNYDETEMKYLEKEFQRICISSDKEREIRKDEQQSEAFDVTWEDLQDKYKEHELKYMNNPSLYNLTNWFICSLYSDDQFGAKRSIDIINLTKSNVKENIISFKAQKNNFIFESLPLSNHILKPLQLLMSKNDKQTLILTKKGMKYDTNNFLHRLKEVFGVDSQYMRRLWASYQYSKHPSPKELLRQAYELNHTIEIHLSDYVGDYKTKEKITFGEKYKFRKTTIWERI